MKNIELLAPAGSIESAKAAINAGADAIYIGGSKFGARAFAKNPEEEDLISVIEYALIRGRKVFMTINTLLKNDELQNELYDFLKSYYEAGLSGVIVQDLGVVKFIKNAFPGLPVHCSTQMTISNLTGARLLRDYGAERVVLSRELSLEEIKEITSDGIETETFVHGALCYCYSGQCFFSSILGGRSGNRGRCAQPCRLSYSTDNKTGHLLSPKDLCTIEHLPDLIEAGIYSFKIEGRMKRAEYTALVTSIYRKYIDLYNQVGKEGYHVDKKDMEILYKAGNRSGFTNGYYYSHNGKDMMAMDRPDYSTGDDRFFEAAYGKYITSEYKEKINGKITLHTDSESILELEGCGKSVKVTGEVVQKAMKAPLEKDKVLKQIGKTGDSPFEFEGLEVEMDDDTFMPVKSLNELRRRGLEELKLLVLSQYRRNILCCPECLGNDESQQNRLYNNPSKYENASDVLPKSKDNDGAYAYSVYIEDLKFLDSILTYDEIKRVYVNCSCFLLGFIKEQVSKTVDLIKQKGKEAFFVFPASFRNETAKVYEKLYESVILKFDGVLVKTIDELGFLKENGFEGLIVSDFNLYSFNKNAFETLSEFGVDEKCAPIELNLKELRKSQIPYDEMIIYGYLPLMVSAQCVKNNTSGCDKNNAVIVVKDRYNKSFIHKSFCDYCYSVIYNSVPLDLSNMKDDFNKLGITNLRINLTTESVKQGDNILRDIIKNGQTNLKDFTRGHIKRGVE